MKDGYEYILGARIKNENTAVKRRILALNLREGQVASVRTDDDLRIVVSYTEKRRKKDAFNRSRGLQRLQTKVASGKVSKKHINNRGYNKPKSVIRNLRNHGHVFNELKISYLQT